jgi:hypothetical protein
VTSIVSQIQASIIGEANINYIHMNEMQCDEDNIEYIQGKTQAPLKPCHRDGKQQVPPPQKEAK